MLPTPSLWRKRGQSEEKLQARKEGASARPTIALKLDQEEKDSPPIVKILKKYSYRSKLDYREGFEKFRTLG